MRWVRRWTRCRRCWEPTRRASWLRTRAVRPVRRRPVLAGSAPDGARGIGTGLRRLHDRLPVADCPFSWSVESRIGPRRRGRELADDAPPTQLVVAQRRVRARTCSTTAASRSVTSTSAGAGRRSTRWAPQPGTSPAAGGLVRASCRGSSRPGCRSRWRGRPSGRRRPAGRGRHDRPARRCRRAACSARTRRCGRHELVDRRGIVGERASVRRRGPVDPRLHRPGERAVGDWQPVVQPPQTGADSSRCRPGAEPARTGLRRTGREGRGSAATGSSRRFPPRAPPAPRSSDAPTAFARPRPRSPAPDAEPAPT